MRRAGRAPDTHEQCLTTSHHSARPNPTHTKVPPTSGWTGFSVEVRAFHVSVGPVRCAGPTDMGKGRPLTNPVQPDVGGTLVWVELVFAETCKSTWKCQLPFHNRTEKNTPTQTKLPLLRHSEQYICIYIYPPGSGPGTAPNPGFRMENDRPDPPPAPGDRDQDKKQKDVLTHSWLHLGF